MIKPQELRNDNYFIDYGKIQKWTPALWSWYSISEFKSLQGVRLTEDWLIKFGFKYEDDWWFIERDNDRFGINFIGDHWQFYLFPAKINFVHQLQNMFFAYFGEELENKLL